MSSFIASTLEQTLMITAFVLFMMVVIEYVNVQTGNAWADKLRHSPFLQILTAALLGITPGCLGVFTVVSLYTHRMIGLAGLVAAMIATSGDEAFVMFALFPGKALLLHVILLVVAVAAGWIVHLFENTKRKLNPYGYIFHEQENCRCFVRKEIFPQLWKISFERAAVLLFSFLFIVLLTLGVIGPPSWGWKRITFLVAGAFLLFVILTVPDHFLKEHVYDHIIKKHLLRIFLWTLGAFALLYLVQDNLVLTDLIQNSRYMVLLIAVLIGLIPESGPHLVFVTLFSQNLLPFSILLANSIVQDGHGMLPLFAESKPDFLKVKLINMVVGFLVGLILLMMGY